MVLPRREGVSRAATCRGQKERDDRFRWNDAKAQVLHWPTWAFAFLTLMYGVGVASSSNFLPVCDVTIQNVCSLVDLTAHSTADPHQTPYQ